MRSVRVLRAAAAAACVVIGLAWACGGSKKSEASGPGQGQGMVAGEGHDTGGGGGGGEVGGSDAGATATGPADAGAPPVANAPVTFVVSNQAQEELAFNMNRGWGGILSVTSGKPPRAKFFEAFPRFCTMSCDASEEERCPVCEAPETGKEQLASQKFEKVAASGTLNIPWNGKAMEYEKTKVKAGGKTHKCDCYREVDPPAGSWTVKLCGLRLTSQTGTNSQQQCITGKVTLPVEGQVQVELNFPAPPPPPEKGKKGKKGH